MPTPQRPWLNAALAGRFLKASRRREPSLLSPRSASRRDGKDGGLGEGGVGGVCGEIHLPPLCRHLTRRLPTSARAAQRVTVNHQPALREDEGTRPSPPLCDTVAHRARQGLPRGLHLEINPGRSSVRADKPRARRALGNLQCKPALIATSPPPIPSGDLAHRSSPRLDTQ